MASILALVLALQGCSWFGGKQSASSSNPPEKSMEKADEHEAKPATPKADGAESAGEDAPAADTGRKAAE
ncbi:MAG: hypothetical protein H6736_19040 [Alphaproteobacteria bacterium]|nr:hypothetical protein [Alphaproteobacteria bacterium]